MGADNTYWPVGQYYVHSRATRPVAVATTGALAGKTVALAAASAIAWRWSCRRLPSAIVSPGSGSLAGRCGHLAVTLTGQILITSATAREVRSGQAPRVSPSTALRRSQRWRPAHAAGTVDITVTTPNGTARRAPADQFASQPAQGHLDPAARRRSRVDDGHRSRLPRDVQRERTGVSTGAFTLTTFWATPADSISLNLCRQRHDLRRDREPLSAAGPAAARPEEQRHRHHGCRRATHRGRFSHTGQTFHEVC